MMVPTRRLSRAARAIPAAGLAFVIHGAAIAEENPRRSLPGVEGDYSIVDRDAPASEPEPDAIPNRPGTFRVGNWDVTISGSVSFEIGTGVPKEGR